MRSRTIFLIMIMTFATLASFVQPGYAQNGLEGYVLAARSRSIELYYNTESASLAVLDRRNRELWKSSPDIGEAKYDALTEPLRNELNSLFILTFTEMNMNTQRVRTEPVMSLNPVVTDERIRNGVRLNFVIREINLNLSVEARIENDSLTISIPDNLIIEGVGSKEAVELRLRPLDNFIEIGLNAVETLKQDRALRGVRRYVNRLGRELRNLKSQTDQIVDALGIETYSNNAIELLTEIQNLYAGGEGFEGIFRKILNNGTLNSAAIEEYTKLLDELNDGIMMARVAASALKGVVVGGIVEIKLLPNFGAGTFGEQGYAFYPDGSGALTHFKHRQRMMTSFFRRDVYSDDSINIDWEREMDRTGMRRTLLPVFGIHKNGIAGFVAGVSRAEESSFISFYPSGFVFELYRVFAGFRYRRTIIADVPLGIWTGGTAATMFEKERLSLDAAVTYMFLEGDNSDYSGMAIRYKEFLLEEGAIKKSSLKFNSIPLVVEILGGVFQSRGIFDRYIPMTTFSQATEMTEFLREAGVDNSLVNLFGWASGGYGRYPTNSMPERQLGGVRALRTLAETVERSGYELFLQDNYVFSQLGRRGFNNNDFVLNSNQRIIRSFDGRTRLVSPVAALNRFIRFVLPAVSRFDISGVTFDRIGSFIYFDYSRSNAVQRYETVGLWQRMLNYAANELYYSAVRGGNKYVLAHADMLFDIPMGATGYLFTDEEIPFYQIVVNGLIPYASKPLNFSHDYRYAKLKAIEYGAVPSFTLTWENTTLLRNTEQNTFFSTRFEDWKERMVEVYDELNTRLDIIADQYMVRHERLDNEIVVVTYSNGARIVINYSHIEVNFENFTVEAMDFIVVDKDGDKR